MSYRRSFFGLGPEYDLAPHGVLGAAARSCGLSTLDNALMNSSSERLRRLMGDADALTVAEKISGAGLFGLPDAYSQETAQQKAIRDAEAMKPTPTLVEMMSGPSVVETNWEAERQKFLRIARGEEDFETEAQKIMRQIKGSTTQSIAETLPGSSIAKTHIEAEREKFLRLARGIPDMPEETADQRVMREIAALTGAGTASTFGRPPMLGGIDEVQRRANEITAAYDRLKELTAPTLPAKVFSADDPVAQAIRRAQQAGVPVPPALAESIAYHSFTRGIGDAAREELERIQARIGTNDIMGIYNPASDLRRLAETHLATFEMPSELERYRHESAETIARMAGLTLPWTRPHDPFASIEGFAELSAIATALKASVPFDPALSSALRELGGDWRGVNLTADVLNRPRAFRGFLEEIGFDQRLTAFPRAAYDPVLDIAGLALPRPRPHADYVRDFEPRPLRRERARSLPLHLEAFSLIFKFEGAVRAFIDARMTEQYGPNWIAERVPPKMRKEWENSRQRAIAAGEEDQPLIAFASLADYTVLILETDHWTLVFEGFFGDRDELKGSFEKLRPVRNAIAHGRAPSLAACYFLRTETRRLLIAIQEAEPDDEDE